MGPDPALSHHPFTRMTSRKDKAMNNTKLATILLLSSAMGLAACSKKAPADIPPPPVDTTRPTTPTPPPTR